LARGEAVSSSLFPNRVGPVHFIEELTWFRLVECHGYERAKAIAAGVDPETNADLAKWRSLGMRGRVA
jgi:hypothetical protein